MQDESKKLIIPVYLNQRIVFDMIAMLEDGISHVTRVVSSKQIKETDEKKYGAEFGLSKALSSLFAINVFGEKAAQQQSALDKTKDEERVHTPASLFHKLRNVLSSKKMIKIVDDSYHPKEQDLVELSATMIRNPLTHTMGSIILLADMLITFSGEKDERVVRVKKQMEGLLDNLFIGETVDIVAKDLKSKYKALLTLEKEYLSDPTMADLVEGKFSVIGKIIRVVEKQEESISLIRKSALSTLSSNILEKAFSALSTISDEHGLNFPTLEWELKGPIFQIIPIAIYT